MFRNHLILLASLLALFVSRPAFAKPEDPAWQLVAMNISKGTRGQSLETRLKWAKQAGFRAQHEMGIKHPAAMVKAYAQAEMHLAAVYLYMDAGTGELPAGFAEALEVLKVQKPQLWLAFKGTQSPEHPWDERVLGIIRAAADLAAQHDMQVVLYPHHGFYAPTVADVVRLAGKAARPNVGVAFNLCHFLKGEPGSDWMSALKLAGDHLMAVTITGADIDGADWTTLIQPLDQGDFPLRELLAYLKQSGFAGTLGIQDYGVLGEPLETLSRSHHTYQKLMRGLATPE